MAAQPGISTASAPPNTVVQVQPGMNVQPVVLVDQNGQYVTASTANALATTTTPVNVGNATAPTAGQVLTATSGTAATWQAGGGLPLTTLGDTVYENATPAPARLAGNTTATKNFLTQTGTGAVSAAPAWGVIAAADLPTGTTSAQGALQLDGTAGDIAALGAQAAGSSGLAADAKHVHPTTGVVLTSSLPLAIASGGTGQATQQTAMDALAGAQTSAQYLRGNGSHVQMSAIQAGDVPTLNQNTSGNAAGLSSTLAVGSGGTGQVTAAAAYNALSPMTTTGDIEYESAANTASRLAGPTSATKQFLTSTGTGSAAQAPAWGAIASADMPTGTTSAKGALQLDGTATDIAALGVQAAGAIGKPADAGHVHPDLNLILAPTGATAETFPRRYVSAGEAAATPGVLYVAAIAMAAGIAVNNITMAVGATAKTGGTHGWYVLLDSSLVVRAVTADQTDASTVWGTINTVYTIATNSYTTTYTGLYYVGVMVAETSGTMPVFLCAAATSSAVNGLAPILAGSSNTGQTTPPSTGTTMTAISAATRPLYAYTS